MQFSKDHQPTKNGRPKGSRNKRSQFGDAMTATALKQLQAAVDDGESWAVQLVLNKTHPSLKPVTPVNSLDGELLQAKIKELSEFEERLAALERQNEQ